ncbi:MAG TPA: 5-formyltetrahydrofolate cyclo-ligase [Gammaproteobacteria bacterium]|nr:5-formyltetrahydrofolate cyclo-ligase [Gammaproteobacteria bacterium]
MTNLDLLRKRLCRERLRMPSAARAAAAATTAERVRRLDIYRQARHVAVYIAVRGELDLACLWSHAPAEKHWYLPVVHPGADRTMQFALHDPAKAMRKNRFGILEPDVSQTAVLDPRELDMVLAPLVAFDGSGHRIGMGAGFYDRAFSFLRGAGAPRRPLLVGVGYEFQRIDNIEPAPWDVPLAGVVTEQATYGNLKEGNE